MRDMRLYCPWSYATFGAGGVQMKIFKVLSSLTFLVLLALSASCGVAGDDDRGDPAAQDPADTTVESQSTVSPELQLITPDATCKSLGGVCIGSRLCNPINGVHPINGSGCRSGTICCS